MEAEVRTLAEYLKCANAMLRAALIALALILSAAPVSADLSEDALVAFSIQDYQTAARLYRELAEQGDVEAQYSLGNMYYRGMGVPENYAEAAKWYRKAAEQGMAQAQSSLGSMYASGEGVPQDFVQAYKWLILALAQDNGPCTPKTADAQDQEYQDVMAYMCERTRATQASIRKSMRKLLGILRGKMTREQIAEAQRLARE